MRNKKHVKNGFIYEMKKRWQLYLLLLPALIYLLGFVYKPMYGIIIAFKDYSFRAGIWGSKWIGFDNFERLFDSYWFPVALKNTLIISFTDLVVGFPFSIIFALAVNEIGKYRFARITQTVSYAPHFISTVVMCGMLTMFLNPEYGVINHLLEMIGVDPIYFLADPKKFVWIYVISGIWQGMGYGAIVYFAALAGVDTSLEEAARIDGANRFQVVRYVKFPVIVPTIIIMFILRCGNVLNVGYEKVYLLQNGLNLSASEVLTTLTYKVGLEHSDFSYSTAASLFNNVINGLLLIMVNKISRKLSDTSLW